MLLKNGWGGDTSTRDFSVVSGIQKSTTSTFRLPLNQEWVQHEQIHGISSFFFSTSFGFFFFRCCSMWKKPIYHGVWEEANTNQLEKRVDFEEWSRKPYNGNAFRMKRYSENCWPSTPPPLDATILKSAFRRRVIAWLRRTTIRGGRYIDHNDMLLKNTCIELSLQYPLRGNLITWRGSWFHATLLRASIKGVAISGNAPSIRLRSPESMIRSPRSGLMWTARHSQPNFDSLVVKFRPTASAMCPALPGESCSRLLDETVGRRVPETGECEPDTGEQLFDAGCPLERQLFSMASKNSQHCTLEHFCFQKAQLPWWGSWWPFRIRRSNRNCSNAFTMAAAIKMIIPNK